MPTRLSILAIILAACVWGQSATALKDPTVEGSLNMPQIAKPGAPAAGANKVYTKSDNKLYVQSSDGVETAVGAGGGGTGDVIGPATNTSGYIPVWSGTNNKTLANGINPASLKVRTCEVPIYGTGSAGALQTTDSSAFRCVNTTGVAMTILAVSCLADNSSTTTTANPIIHGGAATSILSSAVTCGNGTYAPATLNGTPTLADGASLDINISAAGTAKQARVVVTMTL